MSLLLERAVEAYVLGREGANAVAVKDLELRSLSMENKRLMVKADMGVDRQRTAATGSSIVAETSTAIVEAVEASPEGRGCGEREHGEDEGGESGDEDVDNYEEEVVEEGEMTFMMDSDEEGDDEMDEEWLPDEKPAHKRRSARGDIAEIEGEGGASPRVSDHDEVSPIEPTVQPGSFVDLTGGVGKRESNGSTSSRGRNSGDGGKATGETMNLSNLESHTVPQLKHFLRENGLKTSGVKAVLVQRLRESSLASPVLIALSLDDSVEFHSGHNVSQPFKEEEGLAASGVGKKADTAPEESTIVVKETTKMRVKGRNVLSKQKISPSAGSTSDLKVDQQVGVNEESSDIPMVTKEASSQDKKFSNGRDRSLGERAGGVRGDDSSTVTRSNSVNGTKRKPLRLIAENSQATPGSLDGVVGKKAKLDPEVNASRLEKVTASSRDRERAKEKKLAESSAPHGWVGSDQSGLSSDGSSDHSSGTKQGHQHSVSKVETGASKSGVVAPAAGVGSGIGSDRSFSDRNGTSKALAGLPAINGSISSSSKRSHLGESGGGRKPALAISSNGNTVSGGQSSSSSLQQKRRKVGPAVPLYKSSFLKPTKASGAHAALALADRARAKNNRAEKGGSNGSGVERRMV
ncbi:unnamed protein product [Choristocarpus tenellus]